ncbi:SGNH/GDSL hydrolase family protein [Chryseobacterium sediminis]|uniref:SGNH/GDSL hydrolase family protein n=1 Tax=Chryseobacterium sediminis TaxID=1679494 RepID=A0A5B2U9Y7_9FLAO|nr:SGNH/GDSL hydrolase family protein [Chryseobacterium sediminis]KAA2223055.1 SGNH/GDSL hydrolase family protein [Chryseobacterium sediminis]
MEDQVNVVVTDMIPPENVATIDKNSLVGNAISKEQFAQGQEEQDDAFNKKIAEIKQQVDSDFKGIISPTDPTPTEDGSYKPAISSADPGTNYPNAGNLKAIKGFSTMFYKKGTVWTKSQEEMAQASQNITAFESLQFPAVAGTQTVYNNSMWSVKTGQQATVTDIPSITSTIWQPIVGSYIVETIYDEKYNSTTALTGYYNASGVFTSHVDFRCTPKMPATGGDVWRYRGKSYSSLSIRGVYGFRANGTVVILVDVVNATNFVEFTIPADVVEVAANFYNVNAVNMNIQKKTVTYTAASIIKDALGNVSSINNGDLTKIFTNLKIGSAGDSITANGVGGSLKGYQLYIQDKIGFATYTTYGYSGRPLSTFVTPDGTSIIEQFINNAASHDIFTLLAGTNDFKLNMRSGDIGTLNDYKNLTSYGSVGAVVSMNFYQALKAFVLRCYELNPKAKIIFCTPLQRDNGGYTSWSTNSVGRTLSDFVNAIREVAAYESIPVVDFFKEGVINMRNLTQYTSDGLHPVNEGYKVMSTQMIPVIKRFI